MKRIYPLIAAAILQACTPVSLDRLARSPEKVEKQIVELGSLNALICTPEALQFGHKLKFVFILDKSGSNPGDAQSPGTDPNGARRYLPLLTFLDDAEDSANVSYSLVTFSTVPRVVSPFTSDRLAFKAAVSLDGNPQNDTPPNPRDAGWTNFLDTFDLARTMVSDDLAANANANPPISSYYVFFFISDGLPIVLGQLQDKTAILNKVGQLKDFEESHPAQVAGVQVHTGYYFNPAFNNSDARLLMQQIATKGEGQAFQFGEGQSIDYKRFSVPKTNIKYLVKDVYADNVNTVWEGGRLLFDADGDGISDDQEIKLGSNPAKPDSDDNGISDWIELQVYGRPCNDSGNKCDPAFASHFSACNTFKIIIPGIAGVTYSDSDKDGLNDCEEDQIMHSNPFDADSNLSWLPDRMASFRGYGMFTGPSGMGLDPDLDGAINYFELKRKTPMLHRNDQINGVLPMDYKLTLKESTLGHDCYDLTVENIAVLGENSVRAEVFFATSAVDSRKVYRSAVKKLDSHRTATLVKEDFK